jgi:hypothetical protein
VYCTQDEKGVVSVYFSNNRDWYADVLRDIDPEAYTYIEQDPEHWSWNKRQLEIILHAYNEVHDKLPVIVIQIDEMLDIDKDLQALLCTIKELGHEKRLAVFVLVLHSCPTELISTYRGVKEMYQVGIHVPDFTVSEAKLYLQRGLADDKLQQFEHLIDDIIDTIGTR